MVGAAAEPRQSQQQLLLLLLLLVLLLAWPAECQTQQDLAAAGGAASNLGASGSGNPRRQQELDGRIKPRARALVPFVLEACDAFLEDLQAKYGASSRGLFYNAWYDLPDGGNAVVDRLLHAILHQRTFTFGFTGISNTAGHDNLERQSYPVVFGELLGPILERAGVTLRTTNGAMGNTDFLPYSWCVDAHTGFEPDIVSWEMTMQIGRLECQKTGGAVEAFVRTAAALPSRPIPLLINCQAQQTPCMPRSHRYFEKAVGRCEGPEHTAYTAEHDLTVWYKGFGIHGINLEWLIQRYGCQNTLFSKTALYRNKVGTPRTRSWHPGPGAHLLMAEVLTANYIGLLRTALARLDEAGPGITLTELKDAARTEELVKALGVRGHGPEQLPAPSYAVHEQCIHAGRFSCLTSFYPTFDEQFRLANYVYNSTFDPTPRYQYLRSRTERWEVILGEPQHAIEGIARGDAEGWAIDRKWVIAGGLSAGLLTLRFEVAALPPGETGAVVLCRQLPQQKTAQETWSQPQDAISNMALLFDGKLTTAQQVPPLYRTNVCFTLKDRAGNGWHTVGIRAKSDAATMLVRISHLIVPK